MGLRHRPHCKYSVQFLKHACQVKSTTLYVHSGKNSNLEIGFLVTKFELYVGQKSILTMPF